MSPLLHLPPLHPPFLHLPLFCPPLPHQRSLLFEIEGILLMKAAIIDVVVVIVVVVLSVIARPPQNHPRLGPAFPPTRADQHVVLRLQNHQRLEHVFPHNRADWRFEWPTLKQFHYSSETKSLGQL